MKNIYVKGSFQLHSNNKTTQKKKKKKKLGKFTEEPDFVELSTQAEHLRVCILHDD